MPTLRTTSITPAAGFLLFLFLLNAFAPASHAQSSGDALAAEEPERPNVLLAISDDQSWPHASSYGADGLDTPAFDRVAREGVLFENAFVDAPVCSPSRAALLTGRHVWQIGQAGSHWSSFPQAYTAFPSLLAEAGYHTGHTGKGWGPGSWKISGREHNPAGPAYDDSTARVAAGLSSTDYAANFAGFLEQRAEGTNGDAPFYFWYGAYEPHRPYGSEIWREMGVDPSVIDVPGFLPDVGPVRRDIASYAAEIEHFDEHLARMLAMLEERGELENTIVIVTSDNGMPFPGAKSTLYEYGTHVPLAIRWGKEVAGGRRASGPINLIDLAPTILEAAGVEGPTERPMTGESLLPMLTEDKALNGEAVVTARERHGHILWRNLSYPQRAVRTPRWLYIRNFKTERWPVGAPSIYGSGAPPTTAYLLAHRDSAGVERFFEHAYARRPSEQLFNIRKDPACLNNLAGNPDYRAVQDSLRAVLGARLMATNDPRVTGRGDVFERYPYYGPNAQYPRPSWAADTSGVTVPATQPRIAESPPPPDKPDAVETVIGHVDPSFDDAGSEDIWKRASFWADAQAHPIPGSGSKEGSTGMWKAHWGEEHLYLRVKARGERATSDSPQDDGGVTVFLDAGGERALQRYDQNDFQYVFQRGDPGTMRTGTLSARDTTGVRFAFEEARESSSGYVFTAALPWRTTLGSPPETGARIGLDVQLRGDGGGTWFASGATLWKDPSTFGTVRLVEDSP